jgi:hypothetical protein
MWPLLRNGERSDIWVSGYSYGSAQPPTPGSDFSQAIPAVVMVGAAVWMAIQSALGG